MDGMDGLTLLKTIRSNPLTKRMPFIMATGQRDTEMVKTAIQAGVNNYMVKPFNAATMKQKIEAVLGKRSEEHTSELQSLMRISYAVFCLKKKKTNEEKYRIVRNLMDTDDSKDLIIIDNNHTMT